jgi:hypothetical protein
MTPLGTGESQHDSSSAPKASNKGTTVNIKENPHPDPEKGASGNDREDYTDEGGYNFFDLLSHAKRKFVFWWFWGAVILAIPLALSATRFRTVHIQNVRLFGLFCWLAVSWVGLLASYLFVWVLSYFWFTVCNLLFDEGEDYNTFFVDIRHSTMLLAWGFICWSTVPLLCRVDHHHCTTGWVHTFQKVMLAALVVDFVYFVKDLLLELLFLRAAIEFLHPRLKTLQNIISALELLAFEPRKPSSILDYLHQKWVGDFLGFLFLMRRWYNPEKQRKIESEEDQPGQGDIEDIHFEDPDSKWTRLVQMNLLDLCTGYGTKTGYWMVARYIKSLMTKCDLEDPSVERPSIKAETQRGWSKKRNSFKSFFKKRPSRDFCHPLPDCIHERVRSCRCTVDSHSDTPAQEVSSKDKIVSQLKSKTEAKLFKHEAASLSKTPARGGLCNNLCECGGSCQTIAGGGWCRRQVALYVRKLLSGAHEQFTSKAIAHFESFDQLWGVLDRNRDGFASFEELHWLVEDVGESLKEVISGQKNLMMVIWGKEKDLKLIVDEIRLLKTAFTCADTGKTVHIPHTEICTGYIENLSRTSTYFVKSIVLHSEDKVDKCHKEAIRKFQQEELRDLWRNDGKREIFRYHQLPEISVVPIKSEDLEEKGIRVDFKRKEWVCFSPIVRCSILLINCSGSWLILQT